jgi:hypothetical protein
LFDPHIDGWKIAESLAYLGGIQASLLTVAALHFQGRDFKS